MSNWLTLMVEKERCIFSAADVWAKAMTDINRENQHFALGVGFPEGSLGEGVLQLPDYGFFDVSTGILLKKDQKFLILGQSRAPFCADNYLLRLVDESGYQDSRFAFSGDIHKDYLRMGIHGGALELIEQFDVKKHKAGNVIYRRRNPYWKRNEIHLI